MKTKIIFAVAATMMTLSAHANDIRDQAVMNSKMVKTIIRGLQSEQGLKCKVAIEESGDRAISYFVENGLSKFRAAYLCDDGRSAIISGVIGDGGQTATEKFEMVYAN